MEEINITKVNNSEPNKITIDYRVYVESGPKVINIDGDFIDSFSLGIFCLTKIEEKEVNSFRIIESPFETKQELFRRVARYFEEAAKYFEDGGKLEK